MNSETNDSAVRAIELDSDADYRLLERRVLDWISSPIIEVRLTTDRTLQVHFGRFWTGRTGIKFGSIVFEASSRFLVRSASDVLVRFSPFDAGASAQSVLPYLRELITSTPEVVAVRRRHLDMVIQFTDGLSLSLAGDVQSYTAEEYASPQRRGCYEVRVFGSWVLRIGPGENYLVRDASEDPWTSSRVESEE